MNTAQWIAVVGFAAEILCAVQMVRSRSTERAVAWSAAFVLVALGTAFLGAMFLGA